MAGLKRLEEATEQIARAAYQKRFPVSRKVSAPLWEIELDEVKMTDNALGFGKKIAWVREKIETPLSAEKGVSGLQRFEDPQGFTIKGR